MASGNVEILNSDEDFTRLSGASSTGSVIYARDDARVGLYSEAHMCFDTSALVGLGTITAATFYCYVSDEQFDAEKPPTDRFVHAGIWETGTTFTTFYSIASDLFGDRNGGSGWLVGDMTTVLSTIGIGVLYGPAGTDTEIRVAVESGYTNPQYHSLEIDAIDGSGDVAYIAITYTEAATGATKTAIINMW